MTLDSLNKRLLDNLKSSVVLLDAGLRVVYMNAAAEALLEVSNRKAQNLFIGELLPEAGQDIEEIRAALGNGVGFTKHKVELKLFNAKAITVDYTVNPFEEGGETQALIELHSLELSHRISREEALQSARITTRELVRGLAHEIKNPLGGIRGAAQLLAKEIGNAELADYTQVIIDEADRLHNLVDRLLGSRKPLHKVELNIHEVLERVRSLAEAEVSDRCIELVPDYDPSIPPIHGDPEQLIQAVLNIVRNAMQSLTSLDRQHEASQITLRSRVLRNTTIGRNFYRLAASVEVQDNGPGVNPELIDTIFYPMISGRADGSGLGLPIAHGIISQHGGTIECDSKPGDTRFSVVLPITAANP